MARRTRWLSKHFTRPRRLKIRHVTAHHMTILGNGRGLANDICFRTWQSRRASAHYGVDGDDTTQFVRDGDAAWAAGSFVGNHSGIHIEHANSSLAPRYEVSEKTWKNGARLAAELHVTHALGRPTSNVKGRTGTLRQHRWWIATACPGPFLTSIWGQYVAEAQRWYDQLEGTDPDDRIGKWMLINHGAATAALAAPGAAAKWLTRRRRVVGVAATKKPDVLGGLECGGSKAPNPWHYISTKYRQSGYLLCVSAGGRALWRREGTTGKTIDKGVFRPTPYRGNAKELPWMFGPVDGSTMLTALGHFDPYAPVEHNLATVDEVLDFLEAKAAEHGVGRDRIVLMVDTADKTGKVRERIVARSYGSVFDVADKAVGKSLASMTYYREPVEGPSVDDIFVWVGDGKPGKGKDRPRPVEVASKSTTAKPGDLDHLVLAAIINRQS